MCGHVSSTFHCELRLKWEWLSCLRIMIKIVSKINKAQSVVLVFEWLWYIHYRWYPCVILKLNRNTPYLSNCFSSTLLSHPTFKKILAWNWKFLEYCIYSNARRGFFPCIWCLSVCSHFKFKFVYEALNQIALNRTVQGQTIACITKLSCVDKW